MRKVYICSPYRAKDGAQLDRNIDYAQALTKQAIEAGLAPITPHLYMTQCLNEDKPEERAASMAAGLTLLKSCDFVIVGVKYGISEGMSAEIAAADAAGIEVVNADKLEFRKGKSVAMDDLCEYAISGKEYSEIYPFPYKCQVMYECRMKNPTKKLFLHTKSDCKKSADTKRLCRNRKEVSGMETIMKERKLTEWGNIWINEKYFMRAYQALNRLDLETRKEAIEIATK